MADGNIIQEVLSRLTKIETLLEEKMINTQLKIQMLEDRVNKIEENNTWLYRLVIGQVVLGILAFFILQKR